VVLVLHDLQAAARHADQLLLLAEGRVLGAGVPRTVLNAKLLGQAYGLDMQVIDDPIAGVLVVPIR
jgi:iron complex transport system ATP-binding protein